MSKNNAMQEESRRRKIVRKKIKFSSPFGVSFLLLSRIHSFSQSVSHSLGIEKKGKDEKRNILTKNFFFRYTQKIHREGKNCSAENNDFT